MLRFDETQEKARTSLRPSAEGERLRYSFREQAALTVKLLLGAGGSLALLWMIERFVAP